MFFCSKRIEAIFSSKIVFLFETTFRDIDLSVYNVKIFKFRTCRNLDFPDSTIVLPSIVEGKVVDGRGKLNPMRFRIAQIEGQGVGILFDEMLR
jgi:hypothetical protein